ncbi:MAG: selenocysteine-specific translation elongation factor [Thermoanaerobaculum sp.]|nr:selenocysteine-specific translation elongation factor [Thermoanaerobaculum sp.]
MRAVVFATAGHIDHGKTTLVHALTGVWCDRLKEEQERGITLVLGFAPLADPLGEVEVSFVDVPGHERLVHTMVAGAGAVDQALLVVAANEGVMPQTREHLAILQLLGIRGGVVALSKADTVSPAELAVRNEEVRRTLAGGPLAEAPIIACSAMTGQGMPELKEAILTAARAVQRRAEPFRPFRLAADRVFSLPGAGTVVTGTARWGEVQVGTEVWVYPPGQTSRVRSIHVHGQPRQRAFAGERVALALAGLKVEEIPRGAQILNPGPWQPTARVVVNLQLLPEAPLLAEGDSLWLHLLASRTLARVERCLPHPALPGTSAKVILRLAKPLVVFPLDRVVVRRASPPTTLGGGEVLDPAPPRIPRKKLEALQKLPHPREALFLLHQITQAGREGLPLSRLAGLVGVFPEGLAAELGKLEAAGELAVVGGKEPLLLAEAVVHEVLQHAQAILKERADLGLPGGELASALQLPEGKALRSFYWQRLTAAGIAREQGGRFFAADLQPLTNPLAVQLEQLYRQAGFAAPSPQEAAAQLRAHPKTVEGTLQLLISQGRLVRVGGKWILHRQLLEEITASLHRWGVERFDVGQFKERFGLTRKLAIPILEWLDSQRVTRREGDWRRIVPTSRGTSSSG